MMDTADKEEPMDVDDQCPSGPPYKWSDYVCDHPQMFRGNFTFEHSAGKHRWNITDVQYELINHFFAQKVKELNDKSTYLLKNKIEAFSRERSAEVIKIVKDIEEKLSQLWFVELNDDVSYELCSSSLLRKLTGSDCLVFIPVSFPSRRICVLSENQTVLDKALEALCAEYNRWKNLMHGASFQSSTVSSQMPSLVGKNSTHGSSFQSSAVSTQMFSSVDKNSTHGSSFQASTVSSQLPSSVEKNSTHVSSFQSSTVSSQIPSSVEKNSTHVSSIQSSAVSSQMPSSVEKNSTHGSSFQSHEISSQTTLSPTQKSTHSQEKMNFIIGTLRVKIYQSSILDVKVDAIVNAANEYLIFEAGVSKAIYEVAGYDYSRECDKLLEVEGPKLEISKCYSSRPGNLSYKFRFILHAVGPCWTDYEDKEFFLQLLRQTVQNLLGKAESLSIISLAMPAISSGNPCVPLKLCAESYILGIVQFCRDNYPVCLKEIHLVDNNPEVIKELLVASTKFKEDPFSISLSAVNSRYTQHFGGTVQNVARATAQTNPPASSQSLQFKAGNISVKVLEGSILNVKADAVVNAANENLSHGAGVAVAISEAAGYGFNTECMSILASLNRALNTTEVVKTSPGNLKKKFQVILNAVGPRWNQYPDKTVCLLNLNQTIKNILEKTEKLMLSSVAMPAISAGIFGVPLKLCAEMYVLGIHEYSKQKPIWLEEVIIVDIDPSVCTEVKSAYHHYRDDPSSLSISTARSRYPALMKTLTSPSVREKPESTSCDGRRNHFSESSSVAKNPEPNTETLSAGSSSNVRKHETTRQNHSKKLLKLGDEKIGKELVKVFSFEDFMLVKIYTGSIVRFQGDAIICSNDDRMSGIGPLAKAIATAGGSKYSESYTKIRSKYSYGTSKWEPGDIETCSGGNLNVKFVAHAVINSMSITDERSLNSYGETLKHIFNKINTYRKSRKFAMPLIGAGYFERRFEDLRKCCLTLFHVLADFCQDHQSKCAVKELHLINKNPAVTKSLVDVFECNVSKKANETVQTPSSHHNRSRPASDTVLGYGDKTPVNGHHGYLNRQNSWSQSNSGGTTDDQKEFDIRKTGARPKTGYLRSKSMYDKRPSTGTKKQDKKQNIEDLISMSSVTMGSYDNSETDIKTTSAGKKEGNLNIIGLGDDSESSDSNDDDRKEDPGDAGETAGCVICLDDIKNGIKLTCGHEFCKGCLTQSFSQHKQACPVCGKIFGEITGNQPPGEMTEERERRSLPGYEGCGTIIVKYKFDSGIQGPEHPNPGQPYDGTERRGFLPDNEEGRKVLRLLQKAFDRKLTFTIGYSRTTGKDNVVTWNDIHHKTKRDTGAQKFGYPDPTYLQRVQEELAAKGVTE